MRLQDYRAFQRWPQEAVEKIGTALDSGALTDIIRANRVIDTVDIDLRGPRFSLGVSSTFTVITQAAAIEFALSIVPVVPEVHIGEFDNIEQDLIDPSSPLLRQAKDAILCLWRLEDLAPRFTGNWAGMDKTQRESALDDLVARVRDLADNYGTNQHVPLFLATFPPVRTPGRGMVGLHTEFGLDFVRAKLNQTILEIVATHHNIHVFDFDGWAASAGAAAFSQKMDAVAKQPISNKSLSSLAMALARTFTPLVRPSAKVLALDLDGTLWGGVLGEDGIAGLKIGQDFPGNVFWKIQQEALALKDQGVILVLLSKNNHADVKEAFEKMHDMPLSLADFAAVRANWATKAENLHDVAAELNVGLDSVVFIDDQAFERESMATLSPTVRILNNNADPMNILTVLQDCHAFDALHVSEEDRFRTHDYKNQMRRQSLEKSATSIETFLNSLELAAEVRPLDETNLGRAQQMLAKTNQFNVTTKRHSEAMLRTMMADTSSVLLSLSLRDKFGDQGIIGLALGLKRDRDPVTLELDSFLLSCRALGRGADRVLWSAFLRQAAALGYEKLIAEYHRTAKNGQCSDLFESFGLTIVGNEPEHKSYTLDLPADFAPPQWITMNNE